jgi:hypothetical protein
MPRELIIPEFELIIVNTLQSALQHGCFPFIPIDLRTNLLSQSRNVNFSRTMRLFQHIRWAATSLAGRMNCPQKSTGSFCLRMQLKYQ